MVFNEQKDCTISKLLYLEDNTGKPDARLKKCGISVNYETEAPRGDGLYSVILNGNKKLPFWIYERDILLVGDRFIIAESVKYQTFEPIYTVIVDIQKGRYADLKEWYPDITVTSDGIELDNRFKKIKKWILRNPCEFQWIDL